MKRRERKRDRETERQIQRKIDKQKQIVTERDKDRDIIKKE